jgi:hypothetical protein
MKLNSITRTGLKSPAFLAVFTLDNGKTKNVKFGTSSNYLTNPDKTEKDRQAYIKRHQVRENWNDPTSRGALSRFILWSPTRSIDLSTRAYKKRFNI